LGHHQDADTVELGFSFRLPRGVLDGYPAGRDSEDGATGKGFVNCDLELVLGRQANGDSTIVVELELKCAGHRITLKCDPTGLVQRVSVNGTDFARFAGKARLRQGLGLLPDLVLEQAGKLKE